MSTQQNTQVARRWFEEVWNQRRSETVYELTLADSVGHMEHGDVCGREDFLVFHAKFLEALPDLKITIEDTVAEGENVVVRWAVLATHRGDGLGCRATGKPVRVRGMTWVRIQDGKLVESWDCWNLGGLMEHLTSAM